MQQTYSIESMLFAIFITLIVSFGVGLFFKRKPKDRAKPEIESQEHVEKKQKKQPDEVGKKLQEAKHLRWDAQDWIWLISFLLYAQLFTVLYKEMVMDVVSYVSTFVSTALGAVAIYISVREATKIDKTKDDMNTVLGELREKLSQMDNKMDKFDPSTFNETKDDKIDDVSEKIMNVIEKKFKTKETITKDEAISVMSEQIENAKNDLKSSLNISTQSSSNIQYENSKILRNQIRHVMFKTFKAGDDFSLKDLYEALQENTVSFSKGFVMVVISNMIQEGILESIKQGMFRLVDTR